MDKNSNAKQSTKKSSASVDKNRKSGNKKKKKSKKPLSAKSDQSPDQLEVEGVRALDQNELESDSSSTRQNITTPQELKRTSVPSDLENEINRPGNIPRKISDTIKEGSETNVLKPVRSSNSITNDIASSKRQSVTFSNFEDTIAPTLSNISVKQKGSSKNSKTKTSSSKGNTSNNGAKATRPKTEPVKSSSLTKNNVSAANAAKLKSEESLRWELAVDDDEKEQERILIYKMNRRKRYLAAAQEKGLGWVVNYGSNGSPVSEDSGVDMPEREVQHASVNDYSTVRAMVPSQSSTPLSMHGELAC